MIHKLSHSFGLWWEFILNYSLVGLLVHKLGTLSVGGVFTFCSVCFGGLGGFASFLAVSSLLY
jgi:hypothetical protein